MTSSWKTTLFAVMSVALTGWAGSGSAADAAATAGAGLSLPPDKACGLLADKGIPAAGGYRATMGSVHLCGSFQKVIPVSNGDFDTLQFSAQGTEAAVTQLELDLRLKSMGEVQSAFRYLLENVELLAERALGAKVPEEAQVAIRSGVTGKWPLGGATLTVERITAISEFLVTIK